MKVMNQNMKLIWKIWKLLKIPWNNWKHFISTHEGLKKKHRSCICAELCPSGPSENTQWEGWRKTLGNFLKSSTFFCLKKINLEPFFRNVCTHSNAHWFKLVQRSLVATYIAAVKMKEKYPINRHLIVWCQTIIWLIWFGNPTHTLTNFPSIHLSKNLSNETE